MFDDNLVLSYLPSIFRVGSAHKHAVRCPAFVWQCSRQRC